MPYRAALGLSYPASMVGIGTGHVCSSAARPGNTTDKTHDPSTAVDSRTAHCARDIAEMAILGITPIISPAARHRGKILISAAREDYSRDALACSWSSSPPRISSRRRFTQSSSGRFCLVETRRPLGPAWEMAWISSTGRAGQPREHLPSSLAETTLPSVLAVFCFPLAACNPRRNFDISRCAVPTLVHPYLPL